MAADLAGPPLHQGARGCAVADLQLDRLLHRRTAAAMPAKTASADPKMSGGFCRRHRRLQLAVQQHRYSASRPTAAGPTSMASAHGVRPHRQRASINELGTVRGRLGFAVDQVMFYGTGGYAWIDNKLSVSGLGASASESHFHSGWTVGAGVEAFFAPNWSVKGEYLYRSLGSENYFRRSPSRNAQPAQRPGRRELSLWWPDRRQVLIVVLIVAAGRLCDGKGRPRAGLFCFDECRPFCCHVPPTRKQTVDDSRSALEIRRPFFLRSEHHPIGACSRFPGDARL